MSYEKDYVKKHLGEPLTLALTEICLKRPKDPMLFLAQWLLHWQKIKGQIGREREKSSKENEYAEEIQYGLDGTKGSQLEYLEKAILEDNEERGGLYKDKGYGTSEWKVDSESMKDEVELGYPFSLAYSLGDVEREKRSYEEAAVTGDPVVRTYSSERKGIEQMIAEMIQDEIAHYIPRTRRDSKDTEEGIDQGCSVLGRNSLEIMLKEDIFKRIHEGELKKCETEMDSTETLEKLKQEYRVLVKNHLDELLTDANLERIIAEKVEKKRSKIKFCSDSVEDVSKQTSKGSSLEEMIKEQIFQRILGEKVEISRSKVRPSSYSAEDVSKQDHEVTAGSSLEEMIKERIFQKILSEKVGTHGSGVNDGPEGAEDKEKQVYQLGETRNSLEDVLKEQIFQWMIASKTERSDSEGKIVFEKDKFDGDIELGNNSLEEIFKEQIFQRIEAAKAADSDTKVEIDSKNSLEAAIKEQILKRILEENVENKYKETEPNSDDGGHQFKQDSEVGDRNSLAEILKEEFLQRMVAEKVFDSSKVKHASNDDTERVGDYYIVTETNSVEEIKRERSFEGIAIEEVQNGDPEKKTNSDDAEGLIEGYTVTEVDSSERLPEENLLIYSIIEEEDEDIIPV